jgi:predicted RNase H-like HicB family nuclease
LSRAEKAHMAGIDQRVDAGLAMLRIEIEIERESDGRWLGEIAELPAVMAYGATEAEARTNIIALAARVIGERITNGERMRA